METTASPLLGTAYLRAQSTSTSVTPLPPTTSLCLNLSVFKAHLRALRTVDDSIILRLNRSDALSRSLSTSRPNRENSTIGHNECQAFWEELVEGWKGRGEVLEGCLRIVDGSVKAESYGVEKGLDRDRTQLGRGESELEVKRRQMHQELDVERIIRQRSLTFFQSRCPSHPLTPAAPTLLDPSADVNRPHSSGRAGRDGKGGVRWSG